MSPCWTFVSLCQCLSVLRKVKYIEPQTIIGGVDQRTMKKKKSKRNKGMIWDWVDYSGYIGQPYCVTSCVLSTHAIVNQLCGMVGKPLTPCGFVSFFGPDRAQRSIAPFLFSHNLWTENKGFLADHAWLFNVVSKLGARARDRNKNPPWEIFFLFIKPYARVTSS